MIAEISSTTARWRRAVRSAGQVTELSPVLTAGAGSMVEAVRAAAPSRSGRPEYLRGAGEALLLAARQFELDHPRLTYGMPQPFQAAAVVAGLALIDEAFAVSFGEDSGVGGSSP